MAKNQYDKNKINYKQMQYSITHPGHEWDSMMNQSQMELIQDAFDSLYDSGKHSKQEIAKNTLQDNHMAIFEPNLNSVEPEVRHMPEDELKTTLLKYNTALIKKGIILDYKTIKSKNMIDIRKLVDEQNADPTGMPVIYDNNNNRHEFIDKTGWLSVIPCFSEAVIRVNTFRYIYYKVLDIKSEDKMIKIYIHDYTYEQGEFLTNCFGNIILESIDTVDTTGVTGFGAGTFLRSSMESVKLTPEIYRMIPREELHWTKSEYNTWDLILRYADETLRFLQEEYNTTQFHELVKSFTVIISTINNQLYLHKPSRPTGTSSGKNKTTTIEETKNPHEKVVRKVGIISMKSEKPPKLVTPQTVIKYKVAEWTTRGFIRTYKSGKQVHVRESIHHRKALQDKTDITVKQQQVIKFVNKE